MTDPKTKETDFFNWEKNKDGMKYVAAIVAAISALSALFNVWGEKRPVGGFFEEFVAGIAIFIMLIGSVWIGGWAGTKLFEKTGSRSVGWIVGLIVFGIVGSIVQAAVSHIPGVNWRFERASNSSEDN